MEHGQASQIDERPTNKPVYHTLCLHLVSNELILLHEHYLRRTGGLVRETKPHNDDRLG